MNINSMYQLMNLYGNQQINSSGQTGTSYGNNALTGTSTTSFLQALQTAFSAQGTVGTAGSTVQTTGGISTPMDDIFETASKETGVDVRLLKAIGKAESGFDPSATSSCGAMGVMQLMPGTAASLGVTDAYDAKQNIMGGAKYIAGLLKKYDGNVELAVAAYNAGSGNVDKYGGIPPFTETQNYVQRVMEYAGQDFSTGQTVESQVQTTVDTSATAAATETSGELADTYVQFVKTMTELMRLEMDQKVQSILNFEDI